MAPTAAIALFLLAFVPALLIADSATNSYEYDDLNRLTAAVLDGSRIEYEYDAAGNITRVVTPYAIQVVVAGAVGSVTDDLGKLDCGSDCGGVYDLNTVVTLTAAAGAGSFFDGWSGACTGTGSCVIAVDEIEAVTATFSAQAADLVVTKTDGLTVAVPGESTSYTITVANQGPGPVVDAVFADDFPAILSCEWTSVAAGAAAGSAGSGTGDIGEVLVLPAGSSWTYTANCAIDPGATGSLTNQATVSSSVADPNVTNDSATDETDLTPQADLWLTQTASAGEVGIGAEAVFTLTVGSRGPSTAATVAVENILPGGTSFVAATGAGWTCGEGLGVVSCQRPSVAAGSSSQIQLTLAMPATGGPVTNSATVSAVTPEAGAGDEIGQATVEVFGPPTVVEVRSVATTENGELLPGDGTRAALTQLYLVSSHSLNDPAGDIGPGDVTNPDAYRIFQTELGGAFGSTTCTDAGDVPLAAVTYEGAAANTIVLYLGEAPLTQGRYRLRACATGSAFLEDVFGNPLDGDGDGIGGDDFVLDFRVLVSNLLANPNFDQDLAGWQIVTEEPGDVRHDPLNDASEAPTSGSARAENLSGVGSQLEIFQCVDLNAREAYFLGARTRSTSLGPLFPEVWADVEVFDAAGCGGNSLGIVSYLWTVGDTAGSWIESWSRLVEVSSGTQSARVSFRVVGDELAAEAWLDDVRLYFLGILVFFDDFETGDTGRWNGAVP